jgi:glycosyltransferase involved in cell wall biosynthesis
VLYVHSSAGRYGADRQLLLMATGLDPARYRPVVVLPEAGDLTGDLRDAGVEVHVRPLAVLRRALMTPRGLAGVMAVWGADARGLGALARRRGVALVHTNTSVTLGGAAAARVAGVPHVWHVREIFTGFERTWLLLRRLLLTAAALPCVSEATRAQFAGAPKAEVLHDGLALAAQRPARDAARAALGLPPDPRGRELAVAVLGRVSSWKGQDVLVRALADPALAGRAVSLLVAGAAWPGEEHHEQALRALADRTGVAARVHHLGFRDDVANVLGAADVVAVPSTTPDPLPNAAIEAAAAGCCVVASAHGGLPDILRDRTTGVLVAPGQPAAWAAALARLAGDPAQRARLGAAAREDVNARFDPGHFLEAVQALYDRSVGDGGRV